MKTCVLVSGGMDSAVLLGETLRRGHTVHPLFVRCGLSWERVELYWLRRFLKAVRSPRLKPLTIVDVPVRDLYGPHWSTTGRDVPGYSSRNETVYLPGRNILLLSKAGIFCAFKGVHVLLMGLLKGNPFADSTPAFLRSMERTLRVGLGFSISIRVPFRGLTKAQVLTRSTGLPLHLTFSCIGPRGLQPCGHCNKCAERNKVLE